MKFTDIKSITKFDKQLIHAHNLYTKLIQGQKGQLTQAKQNAITDISSKYLSYINKQLELNGFDDETIKQRVVLLNKYFNFLLLNNYDNIFSSQGKLRPTILEEFIYILFKDMINDLPENNTHILKLGSAKAYTNLYFKSEDLKSFINSITTGINVKDQDFAIYKEIQLSVNNIKHTVNLPIIAVEVKTYLDKTMLEGAIATAEKIKMGNPYSKFFVIAENYDVDLDVDPSYSRIDQIYILRKSKRKTSPRPDIQCDVVSLFVKDIHKYIHSKWGDLEYKLLNSGTIL